jgi:hypothetical protein
MTQMPTKGTCLDVLIDACMLAKPWVHTLPQQPPKFQDVRRLIMTLLQMVRN